MDVAHIGQQVLRSLIKQRNNYLSKKTMTSSSVTSFPFSFFDFFEQYICSWGKEIHELPKGTLQQLFFLLPWFKSDKVFSVFLCSRQLSSFSLPSWIKLRLILQSKHIETFLQKYLIRSQIRLHSKSIYSHIAVSEAYDFVWASLTTPIRPDTWRLSKCPIRQEPF